MAISRIAMGTPEEVTHPAALKAALAEFISTFVFVFAGQGSAVAFGKLTGGEPITPLSLISSTLAHAFALAAAVSAAVNVSGGHVNPAVTFGVFIGGHITLLRGALYWAAQLLGSAFPCALLCYAADGCHGSGFSLSAGVSARKALVLEAAMTFGLVHTVYATAMDRRRERVWATSPFAVGLIVGANVMVGAAFDGAAMNPALAFGPALVRWAWDDHWVYWAGPLVGGGVAGLVHVFFYTENSQDVRPATPRAGPKDTRLDGGLSPRRECQGGAWFIRSTPKCSSELDRDLASTAASSSSSPSYSDGDRGNSFGAPGQSEGCGDMGDVRRVLAGRGRLLAWCRMWLHAPRREAVGDTSSGVVPCSASL